MRMSCIEDDLGFENFIKFGKSSNLKITVDLKDVTNRCFTADEEAGKVWCNALNDDGEFYVAGCGDNAEVATEILTGVVTISFDGRVIYDET